MMILSKGSKHKIGYFHNQFGDNNYFIKHSTPDSM